jgi:hypothetical protein
MTRDRLDPAAVAARLRELRTCAKLETVDEAARRLAAERPGPPPLAEAARRRLAELRALCDLTAHLHERH